LATLAASEPAGSVEAVVVDNASRDRDELMELCRRRTARLLSLGRNVGYGAAFNRGARFARGRYVAVANPDLAFPAGSVAALVRFLDTNPEAGVVAPQMMYPDGTAQPSARRLPRPRYVLSGRRSPLARLFPGMASSREFLYTGAELRSEPLAVEAVIGAFAVFRRQALEQVGGFDEGFFMYAEDMDICRRVTRNGWGVFLDPRVRIEHFYGGVRKARPAFSDHQRLKALCRFFCLGRTPPARFLITAAFAAYLMISQAVRAAGLREHEYSWQTRTSA
jgi:N-acetylglucosaminyl-diphospho-decaprenol L-rhamnosyltransferase